MPNDDRPDNERFAMFLGNLTDVDTTGAADGDVITAEGEDEFGRKQWVARPVPAAVAETKWQKFAMTPVGASNVSGASDSAFASWIEPATAVSFAAVAEGDPTSIVVLEGGDYMLVVTIPVLGTTATAGLDISVPDGVPYLDVPVIEGLGTVEKTWIGTLGEGHLLQVRWYVGGTNGDSYSIPSGSDAFTAASTSIVKL